MNNTVKGYKTVRRRKDGFTLFILPTPEYTDTGGCHNGYVAVPKGHKLNGLGMREIWDTEYCLDCNGGVTWAAKPTDLNNAPKLEKGEWVIGFDTLHSWDYPDSWTPERVMRVTEELYKQLVKIK